MLDDHKILYFLCSSYLDRKIFSSTGIDPRKKFGAGVLQNRQAAAPPRFSARGQRKRLLALNAPACSSKLPDIILDVESFEPNYDNGFVPTVGPDRLALEV